MIKNIQKVLWKSDQCTQHFQTVVFCVIKMYSTNKGNTELHTTIHIIKLNVCLVNFSELNKKPYTYIKNRYHSPYFIKHTRCITTLWQYSFYVTVHDCEIKITIIHL